MSWGIGFGERKREPVKRAQSRSYPASAVPRRRRYRGVTAAGFVLLGLICLLARCAKAQAEYYRVTVVGEMVNAGPFRMVFVMDAAAIDNDDNDDHGLYRCVETGSLTVAGQTEYFDGCEIEVYSGKGGLWGFFFRNAFQYQARPALQGVYAFFVTAFRYANACPTDELAHVLNPHPLFRHNAHAYVNGLVHDEADNVISLYTVEVLE